ncbi:MAG: hypothetical protein NTX15_12125 [Candidatus Kapabacteria bacterium]|nr:hypothetical protein [Candidatus Kapabacteria bacterium]
MDNSAHLRSIADARSVLALSVRDAIDRGLATMRSEDHSSVEGTFTVVRDAVNGSVLCVLDALLPAESPFDDVPRDRLRSVASRLQAPYFMLTNFRRVVTYRTDAVTQRMPDEEQVVGWQSGGDIQSLDEVRVAASSMTVGTAIKHSLSWLSIDSALEPTRRVKDASAFFAERVTSLFDDMVMCTEATSKQRDAALRLGTSVLAYVLMQLRKPQEIDRLSIPYGTQSADLMLDLVGAFFRQARRRGFAMLPSRVDDVHVLPRREAMFRMTLADLVHFLHRFDPERLSDTELHRAVDAVLQRCARVQRTSVPTIDAIDLALRAVVHVRGRSTAKIAMLELGPTQGLASVRQILMSDDGRCDARIYAPSPDDERAVVLRSSGRLDATNDVRILRDTKQAKTPWDLVVASSTDHHDRHRLRLLLGKMPIADNGVVVLFMPMSSLHDEEYDGMRYSLTSRFAIEWVFVSDAEALAEPDAGVCCVIARKLPENTVQEPPARFVYLRRPIAAFFPTSKASRDLEQARLKALDEFVAYLDASERGKLNDEAVVRMVSQSTLRERPSWEDFLIPPDILASILVKTGPHLRSLKDIADVSGGLRTGANEVFAPDTHDIANDDLEMQYWQRTMPDGSVRDNIILTSPDDVDTMLGLPRSDRRLLLLPEDRTQLVGTNVLTRIESAERDGIHLRPTVRHRDVWWHLQPPSTPDIIIAKHQVDRWLVCANTVQAFITDAFIGVSLHDHSCTEALTLWMNSSVGLFLTELVRLEDNVVDITVRDAQEFPVPSDAILSAIDIKRHQPLSRRPVRSLIAEFGATSSDSVRQETVHRDRRKLDEWLMQDVFALTDEEQRWVYRFAFAWWNRPSNVRHLTNALANELERKHKIKPLRLWYTPLLEQLPEEHRRTIIVDTGLTRAEVDGTMFGWRVTCWKGARQDTVIDCGSQEEAEIIALFLNLGKVTVEVPSDALIIAEVLPRLRTFSEELTRTLDDVTQTVPADLRPALAKSVKAMMTAL